MIKFFVVGTLLAFISVSCSQSNQDVDGKVTRNGVSKAVLSISCPQSRGIVTGGENGIAEENAINCLEFYVFNGDGTIDMEVGADQNGKGTGYVKIADASSPCIIDVTAGNNKKFVAVVNQNLGALKSGEGYADLKTKLAAREFVLDGKRKNTVPVEGLGMSGEITQSVAKESEVSVSIEVSRLVSKIYAPIIDSKFEVKLEDNKIDELWGKNSGITNDDLSFSFVGYTLANGLSKSDVFFIGNDSGNDEEIGADRLISWPNWNHANKQYLNSTFDSKKQYTNVYSGRDNITSDWFLTGSYTYVYENKPVVKSENGLTGWDALSVYSFILKGQLIVAGRPALTKIRYWRLELVWDNNYYILRDCVYRVTLKRIGSIGHDNPEDAEKNPPIVSPENSTYIDVQALDWHRNEYSTET